jgi:hypothetical protein
MLFLTEAEPILPLDRIKKLEKTGKQLFDVVDIYRLCVTEEK